MKKTSFLIIMVVILAIISPFIWQVLTSFKLPSEIFIKPIRYLPSQLYLKNYNAIFTSGPPFATYIKNSAIVASGSTLFCVLFGSIAAYALTRLKVRANKLIMALFLSVAMFPQIAIVSPLFLLMRKAGLLNTYLGLIIPYTAFNLPLAVWMLTSFFKKLPLEIEEQALIDGCGPLGVLGRIVFPLAAPGIFATSILVFIFAWNEFLFALVFNTRYTMRTVTVGITMFPGLYEIPWGTIFAASTIVTLPLVLIVLLLQRQIISGLTMGAVK